MDRMTSLIHTAPSKLRLTGIWRMFRRSSVPVLMFHGVLPDAGTSPFNHGGKMISPEKLRAFLERIARTFRIVPMDEFVACVRGRRSLENAMVITFDDGYENVYRHAYPVLGEMGLPFTVFVSTGFVDTDKVLSWDVLNYAVRSTAAKVLPAGVLPDDMEIATPASKAAALRVLKARLKDGSPERIDSEVDRIREALGVEREGPAWDAVRFLSSAQIREMSLGGVEFGGHTVTHPILSRVDAETARAEVRQCAGTLEAITGRPVTVFAYPNGAAGDFDETTKRELREAGYDAAFTTIHGLYAPGSDPYEIRRIGVDDRWSYDEFETRASGILTELRR